MIHKFYREDMRKGEYTLETEQLLPMLLNWLFKKDLAFIVGIDTRGTVSHFICEKQGLDSYMDEADERVLYKELRSVIADYEGYASQLQSHFIKSLGAKPDDECGIWQQSIKRVMRDSGAIGTLIESLINNYTTDTMRGELGVHACNILENIYSLKLIKK